MTSSLLGRIVSALTPATDPGRSAQERHSALYAELGSLSLIEVSDAEALAGDIFRGAFKAAPPRFPRHFVLLQKVPQQAAKVVGYVHHTHRGRAYLAGGLVVSAMEFRRLDPDTAALVRKAGGLAEWVMRTTTGWLQDADAVFAYMGDAKSIRVNSRVGFQPTGHQYLHVLWTRPLPPATITALVDEIAAIGPF